MPRNLKLEVLPDDIKIELLALSEQGYSETYLQSWLEDRGYKIPSKTSIKRWLDAKKSKQYNDKQKRDMSPNPVIDSPDEIQAIIEATGYDNINLESAENIIGISQKLTAKNFLTCNLIIANRLIKYQQGECKFPREQIRALKELSEVFSKLYGLDEMVSVNAAIKSLKAYGVDVEGILEDIDVSD